ncbi:MAG: sensor histidine kinase [Dysgonamonadaceae bacterium]|jgi:two-component system sensor histidine kinase AlgZ|nr:sensor histidine kinase [Dysgonamonadaceae bacterium]MDD4379806.1 sensor histidine kinase [Dysgonamonadaceae bacterium]HXL00361.1 sensor histidine kinase [Dysgonamonadaceae bacterium]
MINEKNSKRSVDTVFIHILVWIIVFGLPLFFFDRRNVFSWSNFWRSTSALLCFMAVFYINYLYLIDKFLFRRKTKEFIIINLLLITALAFLMHFSHEFIYSLNLDGRPLRRRRKSPPLLPFILSNMFSLALVAGLSVAIKMSIHWVQLDNERKELEKAKTEAELQNLKSQVNPHFLLNTLNNIYALVEFNPTQAQQAIHDLSKLLRHILYDNNQTFVPLSQEVDFMRNYIDLMRIRLPDNVELTTQFDIPPDSDTRVAPLIFISLIENAFKHGISGNKPSFIRIRLTESPKGIVRFSCENSYFPKTKSDKSGKGIGLEQMQKRLDLLYPGRYIWDKRISDNTYSSVLIIDTKKETENDTQLLDHR